MRGSFRGPALIVHGGAGMHGAPHDRPARRRAMIAATGRGAEILRGGGSALDAVIAAVVVLEDDPLFNAGYGSVLNAEGKVEMDAGLMIAPSAAAPASTTGSHDSGSVGAISRVRNPILLARAVMERTRHLLMVGAGAERLARQAEIPLCRADELVSPRALERWRAWAAANADARSALRQGVPSLPASNTHGTVGAAAVDCHGMLAAATSTGGYSGKLAGRVGDSPILGAGFFADETGAASATGVGEAIIRLALCREAVLAMKRVDPAEAAARAIAKVAEIAGAQAGIVVVGHDGGVGYAHNAQQMDVAVFDRQRGVRFVLAKPQR